MLASILKQKADEKNLSSSILLVTGQENVFLRLFQVTHDDLFDANSENCCSLANFCVTAVSADFNYVEETHIEIRSIDGKERFFLFHDIFHKNIKYSYRNRVLKEQYCLLNANFTSFAFIGISQFLCTRHSL